jgi:uncharacterized membrane protein YbhN (UPF0104 family)
VETAVTGSTEAPPDSPARERVKRIAIIVASVAAAVAFARLCGWDIRGWFEQLWDVLTSISAGYIVGAVVVMVVQTTATAFAWYTILRFAYPGELGFRQMLAAYATCVALNNILPANLGTIVMFIMLIAIMASATFAGLLGGFAVQKIFFTLAGAFVYLYLFLSVAGSFSIDFSWIKDHPWATVTLVVGVVVAVTLLVRKYWPKVKTWWEQAKEGGQVLTHPGAYFGKVFLPEFVAWAASICLVGIFLAAYAIPVTFHTIMTVMGSNSISNTVAITPGGAGVNQAFNVAVLSGVTDPTTATAYSVAQQLVSTAWSILFAIGLMVWVFGWGGGRSLLESSYAEAKKKAAEQKAAREAKKAESAKA